MRRDRVLDIDSLVSSTYDYSYFDQELEIEAMINSLKEERDYVLSVGKYDRAEAIEEEIDDLEDQMREKKWGYLKHLDNF